MYARVMYQHCLCLPTLPRKLNENDAKNGFLACENTKRLSTETRKCPQHYPRARQTGPSHGGLEAINGVLWTGLINPGSAWGREGADGGRDTAPPVSTKATENEGRDACGRGPSKDMTLFACMTHPLEIKAPNTLTFGAACDPLSHVHRAGISHQKPWSPCPGRCGQDKMRVGEELSQA
ncbi:hypothetical protein RRG08_029126 [Elysia crispata]|uniref:Uncharacterized protein n=1 Tax=Elysia crispata TaxID=231223 RepID=A0AAE1CT76_9GAST|nr:hypothetical protein RRG08_029126 [Elysia crispata]